MELNRRRLALSTGERVERRSGVLPILGGHRPPLQKSRVRWNVISERVVNT